MDPGPVRPPAGVFPCGGGLHPPRVGPGRHCGRSRSRPGLRAPDAGVVSAPGGAGGRGLHGPGGLHHGPDLPPLRPLRQELHPHAGGHGLRRARHHGLPDHRAGPGPEDDGHDHRLHPLWGQAAHHRPFCRGRVRQLRLGVRLLYRHRRRGALRHHAEGVPDLRRGSRSLCHGAARLPRAVGRGVSSGLPGSGAGASSSVREPSSFWAP